MDVEDTTNQIKEACSKPSLPNLSGLHSAPQGTSSDMSSRSKRVDSSSEDADLVITEDRLSNGTCEVETMVTVHCTGDSGDDATEGDHHALSNDGMSEFSSSDLSLPEVCISTNSNSFEEDMNYEVQQAYRIFSSFLLDKHKGITSPFLHPIHLHEAQDGIGGVRGWGEKQQEQSMCLRRMEEKFISQEYENITEFVADFRLMLENCYRHHGVDHWISKQAQKLEIMLEQKLTLLSRTLREKTTLAVTSKGRFGAEEERGSGGTSTRRRLASRSLATITVGGHESIMVQTLRLEEQQRAKDEKRQRELEKKEAEEMSAKEVEEWEQTLLSQASPHTVDTLWELPAIGHFLCLAQTALNLPEIIFFELERCLLMPRCSTLLSKIMSSLLSPPQRRATLHRRPTLPYRRWESELRQRVMGWYRAVGAAREQPSRAEQLGLCHQFFSILGEVSPLEEKPFHLLPFYQRVWLLKGLCDHVYETQKDVQDALLSQPIHECRESILGYDSKENAYIHFPHFCGADLRIYCQSLSTPPAFPFPSVLVRRIAKEPGTEGDELDGVKDKDIKIDSGCYGGSMDTEVTDNIRNGETDALRTFKEENWVEEGDKRCKSWSLKKEEGSESGSSDTCVDSKSDLEICTNTFSHSTPVGGTERHLKEEIVALEHQSTDLPLKQEQGSSSGSQRTIKAETQEPCLNVGEHCYTGRSPARSVCKASPNKTEEGSLDEGHQRSSYVECCENKTSDIKSEDLDCCHTSESGQNSSEERVSDKIWTKKKKRKKKRGREQLPRVKGARKQLQHVDRIRLFPADAAKSAVRRVSTTIKRKDKKKKHKTGNKLESSKKIKDEPASEPSFKLVCTSLEELRELISKTEDELDDLESTKKRLGRWYYRREAVKDLHSTLIRLLNELTPWEPKLVKAFQRNRLRLKKEFDDFKKHPEYNNFVREECITSSSSDDDDEERDMRTEVCSLSDHYRRPEEEDSEHMVPRGLWSGASTREFVAESDGERLLTYVQPNHLDHPLASTEKGISLLPRVQSGMTLSGGSGLQSRPEPVPPNQSRDTNTSWASGLPAQDSVSPRPPILHPTTGLPKGYTPIPTLLAKSVGNKVTLMKRPADYPVGNRIEKQSKGSLVSIPTSVLTVTKLSKAQASPSSSQQNPCGLQQTEVQRQQGMATVAAAFPKPLQVMPNQTVPKSQVQVVCKVPDRLGQLVRTESSSSPVKIAVHPAVDQSAGEKKMQQVVILPSHLLIKKTEETASSLHQTQSKGIQVPVSKVTSPLCMSTNVPGFTIPESKIPVQQVAPLKNTRTLMTPSPSVSSCLQQEVVKTAGSKEAQVNTSQAGAIQAVMSNPSPIKNASPEGSTEQAKSANPKQELKTVCIRDSHSILVTTRGGNTGIVKVQTSSDQIGSFTTNPVITISPQFKAFLISKALQTVPPSTSSPTSCSIPTSTPVAQTQKQDLSLFKSPSSVPSIMPAAVTDSVPSTGPHPQTANVTFASCQGPNVSIGSTVTTKNSQHEQSAPTGSHFQASLVKNTDVVPSLSSSGVPQAVTQADVISKRGAKRASTDARPQLTKFILVTPSSSSSSVSSVAMSKCTTPGTSSIPSSGVMYIGQPAVPLSATSMGSSPKQPMATGVSGRLLTTSTSSQPVKVGFGPAQPVCSVSAETLSKVKNIALPSGVQFQVSGRTATLGQTTSSNSITAQSVASLTTNSKQQTTSSFTMISQLGSSASPFTTATLTASNGLKKDLGTSANILSNLCPAQLSSTMQSNTVQTSTLAFAHQLSNSGTGEKNTFSSSPQLAINKLQKNISTARPTNTPLSTSAASTVQQRIIINTSTPLAAGTQIMLNNTRFVVPPQGLGPGSHVLIISSPAQQQVPAASATSTAASVPPQQTCHISVAPRAPVLPQSPVRLPGVPVVSSPFVASTPAVSPALLPTIPNVPPVQQTGTCGVGSTVFPNKTNVVAALPRSLAAQAGNFSLPTVGTPTVVSSPPTLLSVPALASPGATGAPAVSSALASIRLSVGAPTQAECSSTVLPLVAHPLTIVSAPPSSLPVISSPPVSTTSAAASVIACAPALNSSPPAQHVASVTTQGQVIPPQQATVGPAAPSTAVSQSLAHAGLDHASLKKTLLAVTQAAFAETRTTVLPTVAAPPTVGAGSRMQALPIATVTPIGSVISTFETAPVVTTLSSSNTALITPAQSITSLNTKSTIQTPVPLSNQALGKHSLHTSSIGMHVKEAPKILISPDGAVLNTVQCQANPAVLTTCPKQMDSLVVSHNSTTGALHSQDSALYQSLEADKKCTN